MTEKIDIIPESYDFSQSFCPKCGKKTLVFTYVVEKVNEIIHNRSKIECGCGFLHSYPIKDYEPLIGDTWHELKSNNTDWNDQYWNDYQFYETSEGDLGYFCMEWALKTDIDKPRRKRDAEDLITELENVIKILKFRIRSVERPVLNRVCPICHSVLLKKKDWRNNYWTFYCENKECQLFDKLQRGSE